MKKIFFLLLFSYFPLHVCAADYFDRYKADKINASVYVIHGPLELPSAKNRGFMNNPAFIIAAKSVVVIDPGSSHETGSMVLREIKKITPKPVSHIFNTHIHGDHWLANEIIQQQYPEVEIIADPRMIKKARAGAAQSWIDTLIAMTEGATKGTRIAYPVKAVSNAEQLEIAGLRFNIHATDLAHSGTDIMIEYVQGSTFFTGDNAAYLRISRMDEGSFRDSIKALDKAISTQSKYYVPGHGQTGDVKIVKLQREYLNTLYTQVKKSYEEGLEDFEMKPAIRAALIKFKNWSGFEDELGKHISLARLEIEAAEFE